MSNLVKRPCIPRFLPPNKSEVKLTKNEEKISFFCLCVHNFQTWKMIPLKNSFEGVRGGEVAEKVGTNFENMCRFATVHFVGCKKRSGLENKVGLLDFF